LFVFVSSLIELDNDPVAIDSARPKFSAAPRTLIRVGTKDNAIVPCAINVHLLAVGKRKVAEMYAYARGGGALNNLYDHLSAIWINGFLCSRVRRDMDISVNSDLVRLQRKRANIQLFQTYARLVQV
jgi:hypothetical protein